MSLWRSLFAEEVELPRGAARTTQTSTAGRNHLPQLETVKADIRDRRAQAQAALGDSAIAESRREAGSVFNRHRKSSKDTNTDADDGPLCLQHSGSSAPVFQSMFSEASTPALARSGQVGVQHTDMSWKGTKKIDKDIHPLHNDEDDDEDDDKPKGEKGGGPGGVASPVAAVKDTKEASASSSARRGPPVALSSSFREVGGKATPSASSFASRRSGTLDAVQEEILEEVDCQMAHNIFIDNFGFYVSLEEKAAESTYLRRRRGAKEMGKWDRSVIPQWKQLKQDDKKRWCRAGVPSPLRKRVWLLLLEVLPLSSLHSKATAKQASEARIEYERLCQMPLSDADEKAYGTIIERDLPRTFSTNMLFDRDSAAACGQDQLRRVLRAYAQRNREVGYCQGMATLAATLLLVMENELDTYLCFCALMERERYGLQYYYKPGFPELHRSLYVLEGLVRKTLPKVWRLMQRSGVPYAVFATSWLLTLFSHSFNFRLVCRLWDMFLCEGWKPVFRLVLGLLKLDQDRLGASKDEAQLMQRLQQATDRKDPVKILQVSQGIDFTTKQMNELRREYDEKKQ